ncbi:MAG: hypothetical protein GXY19_13055 [Phycisphaerae bacterium]|nr:hypothetical protein [Phycisphaerae bacterium]
MGEAAGSNGSEIRIWRLSKLLAELRNGSACIEGLPCLCQEIHAEQDGRKSCIRALEMLQSLLEKAGDKSLVFCCRSALKVLPFRVGDDDAYLVHTRSVVPDYVHLEEVAALLRKPVDVVLKELWSTVRAFDRAFAQEAIRRVLRQAESDSIPAEMLDRIQEQQGSIESLGEAYGKRFPYDHAAFDVAIYNMLSGRKFFAHGGNGLVKTAVAVRREDAEDCIVRLVIRSVGPPVGEHPLPIIGMVVGNCIRPNECLQDEVLSGLGDVLMGEWAKKKHADEFPLAGPDETWRAVVTVRSSQGSAPGSLETIRLAHEVALHLAGNTLHAFLLGKLEEEPAEFERLLRFVSAPRVCSTEGPNTSILWFQIIADLLGVMERSWSGGLLREKSDVLRDLFELPSRYSPLTPAVSELPAADRASLLMMDLRGRGRCYKKAMEEKLVSYAVELSSCDERVLQDLLRRHTDLAVRAFAHAVRRSKDCDFRIWKATKSYCEEEREYGPLEKLYESTLTGLPKLVHYLCTEALGMLLTGITAGIVPWYWLSEKIGRKAAIKCAQRKTGI